MALDKKQIQEALARGRLKREAGNNKEASSKLESVSAAVEELASVLAGKKEVPVEEFGRILERRIMDVQTEFGKFKTNTENRLKDAEYEIDVITKLSNFKTNTGDRLNSLEHSSGLTAERSKKIEKALSMIREKLPDILLVSNYIESIRNEAENK